LGGRLVKKVTRALMGEERAFALLARWGPWIARVAGFAGDEERYRTDSPFVGVQRFGSYEHHYFFGYYDLIPADGDDSVVLSLQVPGRTVRAGQVPARVGYFETIEPARFYPIGETRCWCWQQGCRLQWYPARERGGNRLVLYNAEMDGRPGAVIRSLDRPSEILCQMGRPIYSVTGDGKIGLSLNFERLGRLRPGYGYTAFSGKESEKIDPGKDGIWRVDMKSGRADLIFSLHDVVRLEPLPSMERAVHYVNHISVNPDDSRFLFFHVWLTEGKRYTRLITLDLDGGRPYALVNEGHVSHYTWKNSKEILCFSTHRDTGMRYHLYEDLTEKRSVVGEGIMMEDGHPSYSPDQRAILTDSYPDEQGYRRLWLFDFLANRLTELARFYSPFYLKGEYRCDLHPRWNHAGNRIYVDTAHHGVRSLYGITLP